MPTIGKPPPRGSWAREQLERHLGVELPGTNEAGTGLNLRPMGQEPNEVWAFGYLGDGSRANMFYAPEVDAAYRHVDNGDETVTDEKWVNGKVVDTRQLDMSQPFSYPW